MAAKRKKEKRAEAGSSKRTDGSRPTNPVQQPLPNPEPSEASSAPLPDTMPSELEAVRPGPPVAGVGASAGGLDAFKKLFTAMPAKSGIAFVLIPHLDPRHESLMVELLARHTAMPVVEATEGSAVEADHVYIIPPDKYLTISGGVLRLTGPVAPAGPPTAIDLFLRSLAEDQHEKAICIILSGTGSYGTLGLQAVKAAGGLAMVQDPATAEYSGMPQSAIETGQADFILAVEAMPNALLRYVQHPYVNAQKPGPEGAGAPDYLNQILALILARKKLDFRFYRKKMVIRRIERRMSLGHFEQFADYLAFLRDHPDEVQQLSKDLLISVTNFFRDPESWQALETEVIAPLVHSKKTDSVLRVWDVGCATGEESYSLGILLLEHLTAPKKNCRVQVFATDVDEEALEVARQGRYPESIAADVSPQRLSRYFTRAAGSAYQVSKRLRDAVTFARQNVVIDPPYSKLDLVICRNLLIYLEPETQKNLISLLHFALGSGGFLFLGPTETIGRNTDLFEPISAKWRIYRRIGVSRLEGVPFPVMQAKPRPMEWQPARLRPDLSRLTELAQKLILQKFAPACVVINRNYEVLYFAGSTEDYFVQPAGAPTQDLLSLARPGLEPKLRVVIQRAIRENSRQSMKDVSMRQGKATRLVTIDVEPLDLSKQTEGLLLVAFQEETRPATETAAEAKARAQRAHAGAVRQVEQELQSTRQELKGTIEELESANEELKAFNEETTSANEELQSINEEPETSKEELQSLNEELNTVNNELTDKNQELEKANNDISNLFNSTEIATLFLDTHFRIKRFTPSISRFFKVIDSDIGRPLSDLGKCFADNELLQDCRQFLDDLVPREKEVRTDDGRWSIRRIVPYRTADNCVEGLVLTFVDITERKRASDAIARLAAIVESSADVITSQDLDGTIRTWNAAAERIYGYTAGEMLGHSIRVIVPQDRLQELADIMSRVSRGENIEQRETERIRKDGQRVPVSLTISPIYDGNGKVVGASVTARDISDRKRGQAALRDREERLLAILNTAADAIITIDEKGIVQSTNLASEKLFGYTAGEMVGKNVSMLMPSPDREEHDRYLQNYLRTGQGRIIGIGREVVARKKNGSIFAADLAVSEVRHLKLFTGFIRDITRRKELEREVVEIASLQQQRIGQDLHDSVGQELTALSLMIGDLPETLKTDPEQAPRLIERMAQALERGRQRLRDLLRGLLFTEIEPEGLMAALSDLADRTAREGKVLCTFDCPRQVLVASNLVATHLYHIAQEAVHNSVKHARAQNICIQLHETEGSVFLRVEDDGIGMPETAGHKGLGLRIMRNRAAIIGATLTIEPAVPSGTDVTCVWLRTNHVRKGN